MTDRIYNVLFLCTGNCRTVDHRRSYPGASRAYSAGSQPKGQVNPHTIELLRSLGYDTSSLHSKSWNEFAKPRAHSSTHFYGLQQTRPQTSVILAGPTHDSALGVPDPAEATGTAAEMALAFKETYRMLDQRIAIFNALPMRSIDKLSLQARIRRSMKARPGESKNRTDGARSHASRRRGISRHTFCWPLSSGPASWRSGSP